MKPRYSLRIFLATLLFVVPLAQAEVARADNPPRKILTGWLPYYSMKTYLPAVLNNGNEKRIGKSALNESIITEITGNKAAKQEVDIYERDNVIDIKRLAGL